MNAKRIVVSKLLGVVRRGRPAGRFALVVLLGFALAWLTWRVAGPSPRVVLPNPTIPPKSALAGTVAAAHLFGAPVTPQAQTTVMPDVVVIGVFAELGKTPGRAVLLVDKQIQIAATGTEIRPGVVVKEVAAGHVAFSRGGEPISVPIQPGKPMAAIQLIK